MNLIKSFQRTFVMLSQGVDESRKRTFLAFGILICIPFICFFAFQDLKSGRIRDGLFILLFLTVLSGNLFAIKYFKKMTKMYRFSGLIIFIFLCYELAVGGAEGHAFLWFYFFPSAAFYLMGKREGILWVFISLLLSGFLLFTPLFYEYQIGISIRFLVTYSMVSILSFGLEYSRNWYYQELMREKKSLENALKEVKNLQGLLPICSFCKRIRDDKGYWNQIETYIWEHSGAEFSHSVCPKCMKEHYPDLNVVEPETTEKPKVVPPKY